MIDAWLSALRIGRVSLTTLHICDVLGDDWAGDTLLSAIAPAADNAIERTPIFK
jgi:hypothetical protein